MGDRANIRVDFGKDGSVYLYSHWDGADLALTLREVLSRKQRWDDEQYLARMIFCAMTEHDPKGETGYGLGPSMGDNEHPVIHVFPLRQHVDIADHGWAFEDYIRLSDETLLAAMREPVPAGERP